MGLLEFSWVLVPIAIGVLIGWGALMINPPHEDFRVARACFIISAILWWGLGIVWGWKAGDSFTARATVVGIIGATGAIALMQGLRAVEKRELAATTGNTREIVTAKVPHEQFTWNLEPLTDGQITDIIFQLREIPKQSVRVVCNPRTGSLLADSIENVFKNIGWTTIDTSRRGMFYASGITGLALNRGDSTSSAIKNAFDSNTPFRVAIGGLVDDHAPTDSLVFVVGAKPIPEPLPEDLKEHFSVLVQEIETLAKEIDVFASDRQREELMLPPREYYPADQTGSLQSWKRGVVFRQQTDNLFNERFGGRLVTYLGQLDDIGIEPAFSVKNDNLIFGRWFYSVAKLMRQGKIAEARRVSVNSRIWFMQR